MLDGPELEAFEGHVSALRSLGLTYVRDDRGDGDDRGGGSGGPAVRLEPEIDRLVRFADLGGGGPGIPDLTKELLAHAAGVAAMREREEAARAAGGGSDASTPKPAAPAIKARGTTAAGGDGPAASAAAAPAGRETAPSGGAAGGNSSAAKNFLGRRAARAKEARTARRAARVGFERKGGGSRSAKLSNTGSGEELARVIRFRYQKGFTQAVRAPCELEDLL